MVTDLIHREISKAAESSVLVISAIAVWMAENRYNNIHTGEMEMLWFREDKHLHL